MVRPAWKSPSLPITWPRLDYCSGTNEFVEVVPEFKSQILEAFKKDSVKAAKLYGADPFEIKNVLTRWVRDMKDDADYHVIPTDTLYLNIDKEAVLKSGMMLPKDSTGNVNIPDRMAISLAGKRALYKGDLMLLEMLANSNWTRPLYVAYTVGPEHYMNLGENFIQEGLVNRITPFNTTEANNFDTEKVYKNMMTRYKYGGLERKGLYLDETVMRMCYTHRRLFGMLISRLLMEGKNDKAQKVIEYAEKVIPTYNVPMKYPNGGLYFAEAYYILGKDAKAEQIVNSMWKDAVQYMNWYLSLNQNRFLSAKHECLLNIYTLQSLVELSKTHGSAKTPNRVKEFNAIMDHYLQRGGSLQ